MPTNLNALIRYKTINSCLYGGERRWPISELIEKCSVALGEYRGRYGSISERTLRDDIRVMRSDILGFNAPIDQQHGHYYYSDHDYSLMTVSFFNPLLIRRIIKLLIDIKMEVNKPDLEIILDKLNKLKNKYDLKENQVEDYGTGEIFQQQMPPPSAPRYQELVSWGDILDSLFILP